MLLRADGLARAFGPKEVITSATLVIKHGERIGLVGRNGSGKTTLIRMLMGELEPDSGDLQIRTEKIGYLPQFPDFSLDTKVKDIVGAPYGQISKISKRLAKLEELMSGSSPDTDWNRLGEEYNRLQEEYSAAGGHYFSSRSGESLKEVGLSLDISEKKLSQLSDGEKTKVMLARVLIQMRDADLLFLDEPTSHLDVETIEWLENYLTGFTGAMVVISHDRYFLDTVVSKVIEMENGEIKSFSGNYSEYLIKKETDFNIRSREAERNRVERERQARVVERQKKKWGYKTTFKTREKLLEKVEVKKAPVKEKQMDVRIETSLRSGNNVVMASGLIVEQGGRTIIEDGEIDLELGDKMGIFGPNGSGKSTIIKAIIGEIPHKGKLWVAPGARLGYFAQGHDGLDPELTAEEQLQKSIGAYDKALVRKALSKFLIKDKDADRKISSLSGGERARVALANMIVQKRNLLVLDEPTNYLDIGSRTAVGKALASYGGTVLIVTHDRYLLDNLCNKIGFIRDGKMRAYPGNYSQVKERLNHEIVEKDETYQVVRKFKNWHTRIKYRAGERIVVPFTRRDIFEEAIDLGYLKKITNPGNRKVRKKRS